MTEHEHDHDAPALEAQPEPSGVTCPLCGGDPAGARHNLAAIGYLHDDITLSCEECGHSWVHGVPIGEYEGDRADELFCAHCEERYGLVHRVEVGDGQVTLHVKCPACRAFWLVPREPDDAGVALTGYPQTTGAVTDGTEPYGYPAPE